MASTSRTGFMEEDGVEEEEELEGFDDFTLASSWERFISEIEATCRVWLADGPKNLLEKGADRLDLSKDIYLVKSELKDVTKSYCMEYYFENDSSARVSDWNNDLHDLQLCFGVKEFLVIAPQSASGVVLDAPEASKLLSAVAIALSNCSSLWPAFVPVHDPSRRAYIGIQSMGTVFARRFEADLIGSQVPVKLMHLEGLFELFVSKFAYSTLDFSMHLFKVHFMMKLTYRTVAYDDEDENYIEGSFGENTEPKESHGGETRTRTQWDDGCPWSEWYSAEDPIKGFELVVTWSEKTVESSLEMAELENASVHDAEKWKLLPILSPNLYDSSKGNRVGFSSQLLLLIDALNNSFDVQFMEDFVSVEHPGSDNLKSSVVMPSPTALDRVLKDLFHEGSKLSDFTKEEHRLSRAIKGAPFGCLFAQFCLHSLWFGNCNIRAIAVLWVEFVREVRWCWEESQPLPKMRVDSSIDLSTCLIHQKLQLLAICIDMKREMNEVFQDCMGSEDHGESHADFIVEDNLAGSESTDSVILDDGDSDGKHDSSLITPDSLQGSKPEILESASQIPHDIMRRGSAGPVRSMMLLKSRESLHAPFTQDPPLMTEDMHEERLQAVEVFGGSLSFSGQLEKDILLSDMSAFKAANPHAVFEDFVRWHSPGDWESGESRESSSPGGLATPSTKDDWPPSGRLSQRMSDPGNLWRKIWNNTHALPASEQKPFLDPGREGEKILHYLETVRPHQLLEQMVCTAFSAAANTLNQTNNRSFKQMTTKMDQLFLTIKSTLKSLQANNLSCDSETIEDIRRLCVVFEHVEKLSTFAASLHHKFQQAPQLSEAIFSDFYNLYLPTMGMGSKEQDVQTELKISHEVKIRERPVVSNMFIQPTANQSWRKVISMGNLLNGHEPILREIIFTTRDSLNGNHYASNILGNENEEIETHRMYICGTSNDLRVALSVSSCD